MGSTYDKSTFRIACGKGVCKKEPPQPKYYCNTCTNCESSHCNFFGRPVQKDYNRCFNHSSCQPIRTLFKKIDNLEQIVDEQEKKLKLYA